MKRYKIIKDTNYFSKGDIIVKYAEKRIHTYYFKEQYIGSNLTFFDYRVSSCKEEDIQEITIKKICGGELL